MSFHDETKARRILGRGQGASEAHTRSGLQRASNAASVPKDQRISLILKAIWNKGKAYQAGLDNGGPRGRILPWPPGRDSALRCPRRRAQRQATEPSDVQSA
jgi:hypothetical protein